MLHFKHNREKGDPTLLIVKGDQEVVNDMSIIIYMKGLHVF